MLSKIQASKFITITFYHWILLFNYTWPFSCLHPWNRFSHQPKLLVLFSFLICLSFAPLLSAPTLCLRPTVGWDAITSLYNSQSPPKIRKQVFFRFYFYCQALGTPLTRELRKIRNTGKLPTIDIFIWQGRSWSRVSNSLYWPFLPPSFLLRPVSHSGPLPSRTAFLLLPVHSVLTSPLAPFHHLLPLPGMFFFGCLLLALSSQRICHLLRGCWWPSSMASPFSNPYQS